MLGMYLALLDTAEQKDKFEYIYRKYQGFMYHVAMSALGDHYLAEDAVHETFLDLIRIIDDVRAGNEKELMAFLRIITHHQAVDMLRKRRTLNKADDELDSALDVEQNVDLETVVLSKIGYEKLIEMVSGMDEKYKSLLFLKAQGYKTDEIAKILKITPNNVKVRLHRARKMLLSKLEEDHGEK